MAIEFLRLNFDTIAGDISIEERLAHISKKESEALHGIREKIELSLSSHKIAILPPIDVEKSIFLFSLLQYHFTVTMLDPWYNKGVGGVRSDYVSYITNLLKSTSQISTHVYLWGFPEIVARFIEKIPETLTLVCWLTWYYKNNPSVIRGWRSSQMTCLHLAIPKAKLYPEHFLNDAQQEKMKEGKLRYIPGPTSVIEDSLLVGFVGKKEQTGHPSQKPVGVYKKLYMMTTVENDIVFDPMSGSGTTGVVARELGVKSILSDISEDYIKIMENRLSISRLDILDELQDLNNIV